MEIYSKGDHYAKQKNLLKTLVLTYLVPCLLYHLSKQGLSSFLRKSKTAAVYFITHVTHITATFYFNVVVAFVVHSYHALSTVFVKDTFSSILCITL